MTLSAATCRNDYVGNGAVDTYSYTFRIIANTDLVVTVVDTDDVETVLTLTTDYTVTGVGAAGGGTIVLVDAGQDWVDASGDLESGYGITIQRKRPFTQLTDIRNQGEYYANLHEDALDHLVMITQYLNEVLGRAIKLPTTYSGGAIDFPLPEAGMVPSWNDAGDGMTNRQATNLAFITSALVADNTAIADATSEVTVSFGATLSSAEWVMPKPQVYNIVDVGTALEIDATVTVKSTTGFTVALSTPTDSANYVLSWVLFLP